MHTLKRHKIAAAEYVAQGGIVRRDVSAAFIAGAKCEVADDDTKAYHRATVYADRYRRAYLAGWEWAKKQTETINQND